MATTFKLEISLVVIGKEVIGCNWRRWMVSVSSVLNAIKKRPIRFSTFHFPGSVHQLHQDQCLKPKRDRLSLLLPREHCSDQKSIGQFGLLYELYDQILHHNLFFYPCPFISTQSWISRFSQHLLADGFGLYTLLCSQNITGQIHSFKLLGSCVHETVHT